MRSRRSAASAALPFTRGNASPGYTLGTGQDEQIIDALEGEYRKALPPFQRIVGEAFLRSPRRDRPRETRMAGGQATAVIKEFPYTVRVALKSPNRMDRLRQRFVVLQCL